MENTTKENATATEQEDVAPTEIVSKDESIERSAPVDVSGDLVESLDETSTEKTVEAPVETTEAPIQEQTETKGSTETSSEGTTESEAAPIDSTPKVDGHSIIARIEEFTTSAEVKTIQAVKSELARLGVVEYEFKQLTDNMYHLFVGGHNSKIRVE